MPEIVVRAQFVTSNVIACHVCSTAEQAMEYAEAIARHAVVVTLQDSDGAAIGDMMIRQHTPTA